MRPSNAKVSVSTPSQTEHVSRSLDRAPATSSDLGTLGQHDVSFVKDPVLWSAWIKDGGAYFDLPGAGVRAHDVALARRDICAVVPASEAGGAGLSVETSTEPFSSPGQSFGDSQPALLYYSDPSFDQALFPGLDLDSQQSELDDLPGEGGMEHDGAPARRDTRVVVPASEAGGADLSVETSTESPSQPEAPELQRASERVRPAIATAGVVAGKGLPDVALITAPVRKGLRSLKREDVQLLQAELKTNPGLDVRQWAIANRIAPHEAMVCVEAGSLNAYGLARLTERRFRPLMPRDMEILNAFLVSNPLNPNVMQWAIHQGIFLHDVRACVTGNTLNHLGVFLLQKEKNRSGVVREKTSPMEARALSAGERRLRGRKMFEEGRTVREIAIALSVNKTTVWRWVKDCNSRDDTAAYKGATSILTVEEERRIQQWLDDFWPVDLGVEGDWCNNRVVQDAITKYIKPEGISLAAVNQRFADGTFVLPRNPLTLQPMKNEELASQPVTVVRSSLGEGQAVEAAVAHGPSMRRGGLVRSAERSVAEGQEKDISLMPSPAKRRRLAGHLEEMVLDLFEKWKNRDPELQNITSKLNLERKYELKHNSKNRYMQKIKIPLSMMTLEDWKGIKEEMKRICYPDATYARLELRFKLEDLG